MSNDDIMHHSMVASPCDELKQWIFSLTWPELQNAMEYTIQCCPEDNNTTNTFNEHHVLMEMIRLLAPPPVPIHPAALASCRPARPNQWVDGRMSESERLRRKRRDEPRLFCFLPKNQQQQQHQSQSSSGMSLPRELQALLNGNKSPTQKNGRQQQQQQQRLLQKQRHGVASNAVSVASNAVSSSSAASFTEYDVVARSFFVSDHSVKGDRWSVPPTENLRRADYTLLQRTAVMHSSSSTTTTTTTSLGKKDDDDGRGRGMYLRLVHHSNSEDDGKDSQEEEPSDSARIKETLRLLRIASRGKFLSRNPPPSFFSSSSNNHYPSNMATAPWFELEPQLQGGEQYWFSLSMYLASQFEVAMWKSFQKHRRLKATMATTMSISTIKSNQPDDDDDYDDDDDDDAESWQAESYQRIIMDRLPMPSTLHTVMRRALSQTLARDAALLPNTRGGALWSLLEESICLGRSYSPSGGVLAGELRSKNNGQQRQQQQQQQQQLLDLFSCPLLQVGSKTDQMRSLARFELQKLIAIELGKEQEQLALQAEKELLQGLNTMEISHPPGSAMANTNNSRSTVSGKKKRAKRTNRKNKHIHDSRSTSTACPATVAIIPLQQVAEREETTTTASTTPPPPIQQDASSSSSEDDDDDDKDTACLRNSSVLDFPENATISQRVRNRNIVLAWSILDDIVKEVFVQVGLPPDEPDGFDDEQQQQPSTIEEMPPINDSLPLSTMDAAKGNRHGEPTIAEDEELTWPYDNSRGLLPTVANSGADHNHRALGGSTQHPMRLGTTVPIGAKYRGAFDVCSSPYNTMAGRFFVRPPDSIDFAWDGHEISVDDGSWDAINGYGGRDRSIMEEFFLSQQRRDLAEENVMASSTMASIASSAHESETEDGVDEELGGETVDQPEIPSCPDEVIGIDEADPLEVQVPDALLESNISPILHDGLVKDKIMNSSKTVKTGTRMAEDASQKYDSRSPSPQAPATPSPTLSPILVSLADLREMRQDSMAKSSPSDGAKAPSVRSFSSVPTASMPASPQYLPPAPQMVTSLSRDNLRAAVSSDEHEFRRPPKASPTNASDSEPVAHASAAVKHALNRKSRDDHDIKTSKGSFRPRPMDALESYRNAAARSLKSRDDQDIRHLRASPPRSTSYRNVVISRMPSRGTSDTLKPSSHFQFDSAEGVTSRGDRCVRSEMGHDDNVHWHESRRSHGEDHDNNTVTRDGSTTITSALSHRETEDSIREERDTFRDICLTLGAEVAKLKNVLAAQQGSIMTTPAGYAHNMARPAGRANFFDPESVAQFFYNTPRSQTLAAMSDAGFRGEHESVTASEDEVPGKLPGSRHVSSGATVVGSDVSIEHSAAHLNFMVGIPTSRDFHDPIHLSGVQSRLAADIMHFVDTTNVNLRKQDVKRSKAVERMTRLVNTVWPRAQVKLYGSHVTGLSLPSSDVDFVICLPAVHKNAPAVAPGALEGRNAINETSQKLLARKLKSESWIDPRSMKLIERTVVPVIKVATKDTKAKTLQLDITFDGPSHHGLEAVELVSGVLEELPMIRPLVLVLKQFLLDRGLLAGFTGGLSSYCLFLMTARYLQEQVSSWSDCGSLLMGFLDFYGNHFDPRTTGISVGCGQYFARPTYAVPHFQASPQPQPMWDRLHRHNLANAAASVREKPFTRRNSFNDKGSVDGIRGTTTGMTMGPFPSTACGGAPPLHYPAAARHVEATVPVPPPMDQGAVDHGMPYTFDPLFVEDPLSPGNNVGRNAFRIVQVQRAFSDAHRALVAALEWDMQSSELQDGAEYPLLKCLLQTEDVVYDL